MGEPPSLEVCSSTKSHMGRRGRGEKALRHTRCRHKSLGNRDRRQRPYYDEAKEGRTRVPAPPAEQFHQVDVQLCLPNVPRRRRDCSLANGRPRLLYLDDSGRPTTGWSISNECRQPLDVKRRVQDLHLRPSDGIAEGHSPYTLQGAKYLVFQPRGHMELMRTRAKPSFGIREWRID